MFNPQYDKVVRMITHITDKHVGEIDTLVWKYVILEYTDYRTGALIEQPSPVLLIDFK